jgi:hypothetical protein
MRYSAFAMLFLMPAFLAGQDYEYFVSKADRAMIARDSINASRYYDSAFAFGGVSDDYYNAACANALSGNTEKSVAYLRKAFATGYSDFTWMYYDRDLNSIRTNPEYEKFERERKDPSVIYYFDLLRLLLQSTEKHIQITKRTLMLLDDDLKNYSIKQIVERVGGTVKLAPGDTLLDLRGKTIKFDHCNFNKYGSMIRSIAVDGLLFSQSKGDIVLSDIRVNNLMFYHNDDPMVDEDFLSLQDIRLNGVMFVHAYGSVFVCNNSTFNIKLPESGIIDFGTSRFAGFNDRDGLTLNLKFDEVEILNSRFVNGMEDGALAPIDIIVTSKMLDIQNSIFRHTLVISGVASESLNFTGNSFPKFIDMVGMNIPESRCYSPFSQFAAKDFVRIIDARNGSIEISGDSVSDFKDVGCFDQVTSVYKKFYDIYRSRGELISANDSYVRLKQLEVDYLGQKADPTLEDTMRLRLNQLMGFYTDYATSPGKALLISFYIVLLFAGFYFFFPSEWDKESKRKLIEQYRIFIGKNEHGYVKPFFRMLGGFGMSFLNAMTLSMNSFITLGFGTIPTSGLARYVCVLQGVVGWFLLSLFTVALLNQVLI